MKKSACLRGAAWTLLLFFVCSLQAGCASEQFQMLTRVEELYPSASRCGKCHADIYEEWKESDHSNAYSDNAFRLATSDHAFQDCLGCHAPVSIHNPGVPTARGAIREEGVTCVSCHYKQGRLTGPVEPTAALVPHEVGVEKEFFATSALCGVCHQGTHDEWRRSNIENKKTCQDCHMPEVTRKVTQATDVASKILVSMEEEHVLKRHTFDYGKTDSPEEAVAFDIEWVSGESGFYAEVAVTNKLPHFIPTGDFGFRKGILEFTAKSNDGKVVSHGAVDLYKEIKTALEPMVRRSFRLPIPDETHRLEIVLKREGQDETNGYIIGKRTFVRKGTDG